ncbi:sterol desaturase family protein [Elongatibacter sediminis]|uniref:Sterol desaturase family protein n=1 Tax=Elongatibacter sediminis TaxID=3119006 RepID=A0AAW9RAM4_9GAMM
MNATGPAIPPHLAPRQGELVMFEDNRLLERLSRISPVTVAAVFGPVIVASAALSIRHGTGVGETALLFAAGALFWSLFEYVFHRFVFHFDPHGPFQERLQFILHGVHHQYPNDRDRLVMPVTVSIPLAALFLWGFLAVLDTSGWGFFAGFAAGYLGYDMMHYAIHHAENVRHPLFRTVRRHHLAHHFRDTRRGFGVSTPVWDRVFRT